MQGVGFRFFADDQARAENLAGYARNLPDGTVETIVEGEEESVRRFERAMNRGPRGAFVERVKTETIPVEQRRGFSIRS